MIDQEDFVGVRGSDTTGRVDHERIERVISKIERDPESFNMTTWGSRDSCGTTHCFAGHLVDDEGIAIDWFEYLPGQFDAIKTWDGRIISDVAAELIGMPKGQADRVFLATWLSTPDQLRRWIDYVLETPDRTHEDDLELED